MALYFTLHLNPPARGKTIRQHVNEFDFFGLFLLVGGVVCLLLGFNQSENSCALFGLFRNGLSNDTDLSTGNSPATIALLVVGCVMLAVAAGWEMYTSRSPIIPPRLFKVRSLLRYQQPRTST